MNLKLLFNLKIYCLIEVYFFGFETDFSLTEGNS